MQNRFFFNSQWIRKVYKSLFLSYFGFNSSQTESSRELVKLQITGFHFLCFSEFACLANSQVINGTSSETIS